jgi:hypothetical protein
MGRRFRKRDSNPPAPGQGKGRPKGNRTPNSPNKISRRNLLRLERLERELAEGKFSSRAEMLAKFEQLKLTSMKNRITRALKPVRGTAAKVSEQSVQPQKPRAPPAAKVRKDPVRSVPVQSVPVLSVPVQSVPVRSVQAQPVEVPKGWYRHPDGKVSPWSPAEVMFCCAVPER